MKKTQKKNDPSTDNSESPKISYSRSHYLNILKIVCVAILFYVIISKLVTVSIFSAISFLFSVLSPLIIGLSIAFILNLPLKFFETKVFGKLTRKNGKIWSKLKRPVCIIISLLLVLSFVIALLAFIIPEFIDTCTRFFLKLPDNMTNIEGMLRDLATRFNLPIDPNVIRIDWDSVSAWALTFFSNNSSNIAQGAINILTTLFDGIVNFVIGFVFSIYVLSSKEALGKLAKSFLYSVMKREHARKFVSVVLLSNKAFAGFISGQCIEVLLIGALCFIGMLILQFPYAIMISSIVAITAFIPIFGGVIGSVIGALLIFVEDPIKAIWFLVFVIVLLQVESNVIYPKMMGKHIGLPGIWVLIAVTLGGGLFGPVGILLSVPICSVLYTLFERWIIKRLEERNICHRSMSHDSSEPKSIIEEMNEFEFEEEFSDDMYEVILEEKDQAAQAQAESTASEEEKAEANETK